VSWFGYQSNDDYDITKQLLSDETARKMITKYYYKILYRGDYYTVRGAKKQIIERNYCPSKTARLISVLELVNVKNGISKAREYLINERMNPSVMIVSEFNRSLRELDDIGVNPVTIPKSWKIKHIPNLLKMCETMTAMG
jgi:hypothetical protein